CPCCSQSICHRGARDFRAGELIADRPFGSRSRRCIGLAQLKQHVVAALEVRAFSRDPSYRIVRSSAFTAASPRAALSLALAIKGRVNAELRTILPPDSEQLLFEVS